MITVKRNIAQTIVTLLRQGIMVFCLFFFAFSVQSQPNTNEIGLPLVRFFSPADYKNHDENFAITQDKRGIMYFGNFAGILEYDGISWKLINTTNQTKVSALYCNKSGTIYVGARDEFGYLSAKKDGSLVFKSLSQNISSAIVIGQINKIIETSTGVYFISNTKVFKLANNKITQIPISASSQAIFANNDELIVQKNNNAITQFNLSTPSETNTINSDLKDISGIVSINQDSTIIFTEEQGLFILANNKLSKFRSAADNLLVFNTVSNVFRIDKNTIAVWSEKEGLVLINNNGAINKIINYKGDLQNARVNSIFKDRDGNLWLALDNGIAHINLNSPISTFSAAENQLGNVNGIINFQNRLYAATSKGLFYLKNATFYPINGINSACWGLAIASNYLFVATSNGVHYLTSTNNLQRITREFTFSLTADRQNPAKLYAGFREGLGELSINRGTITYQQLEKFDDNINNIVTDDVGNLWLETISEGIFRYNINTKEKENYAYTNQNGALTRVGNHVLYTSDGLMLYNAKGVFQYNKSVDSFLPSPFLTTDALKNESSNKNWFGLITKQSDNSYWATRGDDKNISYYKKTGAYFQKDTLRFLPLSEMPVRSIHTDGNRAVWLGGSEEIVRVDLAFKQIYARGFQTFIRKISKGDSVLFNGYSTRNESVDKFISPTSGVIFKSQINELKFDFSAASYEPNEKILFQYFLDGFDNTWSSWTPQSSKEYNNLSPGTYTFQVKAKNVYGIESSPSTFTFTIATPVYKRWWALATYLVIGLITLFLLARLRLRKVNQERQQLENLIKERTEEVVEQKMELERQSEELFAKNDQLEKIDLIVQSINSEVDFSNLFQTILAKFSVIRNMDNGSFLIYDKATDSFKFKALRGIQDLTAFESIELTLAQAETRYLYQAEEVYEDIYYKNDFQFAPLNNAIDNLNTPKSLLTIVIKNEGQIEGFILLENISRSYAFDQRDINMIRNLKEHLIAAYIKTRLLENLESTLNDLKNTQAELIRQEKLASVGQLTKGIVDRILNPLNYVNNFSQSSDDLIDDVVELIDKQKDKLPPDVLDDLVDELSVLKNNQIKIQEHSNSTTRILKDMQKLLREKSKDFLETDLNSFIESKAKSAFQETKAGYKDFNVNLILNLDNNPVRTKLLPYEFGQVVQNIISNSYYTLYDKNKSTEDFIPEVRIDIKMMKGQVYVRFRDNGKGIPQQEAEKIFSPFFTTKPTSKGTGLGLFMVKDIIETHKGRVEIKSKEGEFTEILVILPAIST